MFNTLININSRSTGLKAQYLNEHNTITSDEVNYILDLLEAGITEGDTFGVSEDSQSGGYFGVVKSFD